MLADDCSGITFAFEAQLPEEKDAATIARERKRPEVCQAFQTGRCTMGDACPERHIITPLRRMHQLVCRHWLRGACVNGDNCLYLHEYVDQLVPQCVYYQRFGECTNPECSFRHIHPDELTPKCAAYERGFCPLGPACKLRHVKRTDLCPFYMAGFCPLGPSCTKGHPTNRLHDRHSELLRIRERLTHEREGDPSFDPKHTCFKCFDPGHLPKPQGNCPGVPNGHLFRALMAVHEPGEQRTFLAEGRLAGKHCFYCGEEDHEIKNCPMKAEVQRQRGGPRIFA